MESHRFDTLTRALSATSSRRGVSRAFAGLALGGVLGAAWRPAAGAKQKPCGSCQKRKNGKCKPKTDGTPCETGRICHNGKCKPPTCKDDRKNGSETDVDCGGTCPRCANGMNCGDKDDCASAYCPGGTCQACNPQEFPCGSDTNGPTCLCLPPATGGSAVCVAGAASGPDVISCEACADDEFCRAFSMPGEFACYKRCGAF